MPDESTHGAARTRARQDRAPGIVLGLGLGGFVDGIVAHQLLQWHHMVSSTADYPVGTIAGLRANTVADGIFHVAAWALVAVGLALALRARQKDRLARSGRFHVGLLLIGWGAFNLVEGLVNHHLLGVHHVRDDVGAPLSWDLGFLALGAVLVAAGWAVHRRGARDQAS